MKLNKLFLAISVFFMLGLAVFAKPATSAKKIKVVTTIFPEYDWVKEIVGEKADNVELTLLMRNGVDLHSYQPSIKDIAKISDADIFIFVGGESDEWAEDAVKNAKNKSLKVINLLEVLGDKVKNEEIVEGMEHDEEEHEHSHSKEVSTFEDSDVEDRSLADWAGDWQSPYPFVLSGELDEAWEEKAEDGKKSAAEYKEYYAKGYKTDIKSLSISGDKITYTYDSGKTVSAQYKYTGFYIQHWSGGTKAAMYRFVAVDKNTGAPVFIEINDHMIESAKAEHFHLRMSNTGFDDIVDVETSFPTFFPSSMSASEIAEHLAGHHHHEEEKDEHVWLSLSNAMVLCDSICDALSEKDAKSASVYKKNAASYKAKLSALDKKYKVAVSNAKNKTLLFADRFPFRYLADDYGLSYYAAFAGCHAETEASFKTIVFLSNKVDELSLSTICKIEGKNDRIAKAVIANSKTKNLKIVTIDSLQSTTDKQIKKGTTYLNTMEKNLEALKQAL